MPIPAINSTTVQNPEIPFDKLVILNFVASGRCTPQGIKGSVNMTFGRFRELPDGSAQLDPSSIQTRAYADVFAQAASDPTFATLLQQFFTMVATFNAAQQIV